MPVQVGFIGAGSVARRHAAVLERLPDAHIVAFCDIAAPRAEALAEEFDATAYASATRMLARESLDALYICVPPTAHGPYEIAGAKAGCALFIEPPVALNLRTAQSVQGAIGKSGVLCSVGSYWRYYEATERLRKLLTPKNAPKPLLLSGQWLAGPPTTAWRRDAKAGGLWLEEAYALLDLVRLLGGEVKRASAFASSLAIKADFPDATLKDACSAIMQLQSGALASLGTGSFLEEGFEAGFSVATQDACFWLRDGQLETRRGVETSIFSGPDDAFALQSEAFLRAVQNGKRTEIRATYADAIKTLRLGLALNRASLGGKAVEL